MAPQAFLLGVGRAQPPREYDQDSIARSIGDCMERHAGLPSDRTASLGAIHRATQIRRRRLVFPLEQYGDLGSFPERNRLWLELALPMAERAARDALERSRLSARDIDYLGFVTVTGLSVPSLDAHLVSRLGLRADVKRTPCFGLGCAAGAAGLARTAEVLRGDASGAALFVSVELCSLTFQATDGSAANMVASGLFADGAAAAVLVGNAHPRAAGPAIVSSASKLYPDTERVLGWDLCSSGFRIVLTEGVPALVETQVTHDVRAFLGSLGSTVASVDHWVVHSGGPKVLDAFSRGLGLHPTALDISREALRTRGNLSSASVLFTMNDLLDSELPRIGDVAMMAAMGPGFSAEMVLWKW